MAHIEQDTTINVPVEAVFRKLLEPEKGTDWFANLEEVRNLTGHDVGSSYEWTFNMAGCIPLKGKNTFTTIVPNERVSWEGKGGVDSTWDWRLAPTSEGSTHVRAIVDYNVPGSFLGAIADKLFIERQNEKDLRQTLANLKQLLEKG